MSVFKVKPMGLMLMDGKCVNHRSILKVALNPLLRVFSWQIASEIDLEKLEFKHYIMNRCEWKPNMFKNYYSSLFSCNEYNSVKKV